MSTTPISNNYAQLTLIDYASASSTKTKQKRKVEDTFSKIRQLHEELNNQLIGNASERPAVHSPAEAAEIFDYFIGALDHEELWVMCLDTRSRVMNLVALYKGCVNSSQVRIAEVFHQAIIDNSPSIIIAHNHPSGDTTPSPEDVAVTRNINQAGRLLEISVLDHLVVSRGRFVSLKEKGMGF